MSEQAQKLILRTCYGPVDLAATSSTVDSSCPFVPPQAIHAGAAELERARDPAGVSVRDDVISAVAAASSANLIQQQAANDPAMLAMMMMDGRGPPLSYDNFESVSLKMLGTRYQQLISVNGRMHKQIKGMHREMVAVVDPALQAAEAAEAVREEELAPALEHVRRVRDYAAQSVAVVGLARRRQNLRRLETMLVTASTWAERVTAVKGALRELRFVDALRTIATGVALEMEGGQLQPATALAVGEEALLDRAALCSGFDEGIDRAPVSGDSFALHFGAATKPRQQHRRSDSGGHSSSATTPTEQQQPPPPSASQQQQQQQRPASGAATPRTTRSRFADPAASDDHHYHAEHDGDDGHHGGRSSAAAIVGYPDLASDDVMSTLLGRVCFRRWKNMCEPSNPVVMDIIRRAMCCTFALGWRAVGRMKERRLAEEALQARLRLLAQREEAAHAAAVAAGTAAAAGRSSSDAFLADDAPPPFERDGSSASSASFRAAGSGTRGAVPPSQQNQQQQGRRGKLTSPTLSGSSPSGGGGKKKKKPKSKDTLGWTSSDDDGAMSEHGTTGSCSNTGGGGGGTGTIQTSASSRQNSDDDDNNDSPGTGATGNNGAKSASSGKNAAAAVPQQLFEWLLADENINWDCTAAPPDIRATYDLAMAVHTALVFMACNERTVDSFVRECADLASQHLLNFCFNDTFGESKSNWTQVAATLVPSELERAVLRFAETVCAFLNRACVVAQLFASSASSSSSSSSMTMGLTARVVVAAAFDAVDRHVNTFCSTVPWQRSTLAEVMQQFQILRVVVVSVFPLLAASLSSSSSQQQPASSLGNAEAAVVALAKKQLKDVVRSLDYRASKVVQQFAVKSVEETTQLMRSEMFAAFAATTEDFPDTMRPLVMGSEEKVRIWGEEFRTPVASQPPSPDRGAASAAAAAAAAADKQNKGNPFARAKAQKQAAASGASPTSAASGVSSELLQLFGADATTDSALVAQLLQLRDSTDFAAPLLLHLRDVPNSCSEDTLQPPYSPLDAAQHTQHPVFTFASSFCCRKIIDVTRAARFCPAASSPLLRVVTSLACSYIWFVAQQFMSSGAETLPLDEDPAVMGALGEGMQGIVALCKQHATAFGCPSGFPRFPGQPCHLWRAAGATAQAAFGAEQRTAALLSLPVLVACYRRCVQCVAALLPAEDVQSHMELYDGLSSLVRYFTNRDMRRLAAANVSIEEIAGAFEKLKWDGQSNAAASGAAVTVTLNAFLQKSIHERLRPVFAHNPAAKPCHGRALKELLLAFAAGIVEGMARIAKRCHAQHGREALVQMSSSVFRQMRSLLPTASTKVLQAMTMVASVAGETNFEILKSFVLANHAMFTVKQIMLLVEQLGRSNRNDIQQLVVTQLRRDPDATPVEVLDHYCGEWQ